LLRFHIAFALFRILLSFSSASRPRTERERSVRRSVGPRTAGSERFGETGARTFFFPPGGEKKMWANVDDGSAIGAANGARRSFGRKARASSRGIHRLFFFLVNLTINCFVKVQSALAFRLAEAAACERANGADGWRIGANERIYYTPPHSPPPHPNQNNKWIRFRRRPRRNLFST